MRYSCVNLPSPFIGFRRLGQGAPSRYVPANPINCADPSSVADYQKALASAAAQIAYYQNLTQQAAAAGDDAGVNTNSNLVNLANGDWNAWNAALTGCKAAGASPVAGPGISLTTKNLLPYAALAGAVLIVGAVFFYPKVA